MERLKQSNKSIGIKQTLKTVQENKTALVYVARDADQRVVGELISLCIQNGIQIEYADTMKQLGKACGIDIGASAACILIV